MGSSGGGVGDEPQYVVAKYDYIAQGNQVSATLPQFQVKFKVILKCFSYNDLAKDINIVKFSFSRNLT